MRLTGRSALVLGASSGIGLAKARLPVARGVRVIGPARSQERLAAAIGETEAIDDLVLTTNSGAATGITETACWDGVPPAMRETFTARAAQAMPLRRLGAAEEIAEAVLALITNRFITGAVLPVDGGMKVS